MHNRLRYFLSREVYDEKQAERTFGKLTELFEATLK